MAEDTFRAQSSKCGGIRAARFSPARKHLCKINHNPRGHRAHATNGKIHHGGRRPWAEGYTLTHGAPVAGWPICVLVVLGTLAIMAVWTITIATYFTFRGSDNRSRPDKSSVKWASPAAQPAHTCNTKRESRAIQWTRRSSCTAERDSMGAFELKTSARA
jgi:hypothetical protein